MSHNAAQWRLIGWRTGYFVGPASVVLVAVMIAASAFGQLAELESASKVAQVLASKDFVTLILICTIASIMLNGFLVRHVMALANGGQVAAVETAQAVQRLADVIERRREGGAIIEPDVAAMIRNATIRTADKPPSHV